MTSVTVHMRYDAVDDPDCYGDYREVVIKRPDGLVLKTYGDHYHDKGREKAQGFIDGLRVTFPNLTVNTVQKADWYD